MSRTKRRAWMLAGLTVLVAGLLCLNYTKASTHAHHVEWAAEHGMPAPGPGIFGIGVAALALGSAVLGFALGRR